ncbi:MAG: Holliday junction resolvase RuvX [Candidatus Magasanikbacteria bacterium CG11_big_fil_rev_8_21_14_0_20_43_7]|uniref:Putative pre-16S rRNA nuclease n=1 Tax=Candidatus Magasanikbacteria bacterium CG11_big_fil_rev_8_21_14_0_20_43_7 TaxID=1974654 RepID=A0A2H0N2Q8_9BACT|nr:MAG: Holliday junction resolvase RuvX [Candidatus Magasanikbacteria bacterium CG11_big_fil_rev_8_21_14_0_20_43_7]
MNILGIDYGQKRIGLAWVQEGLDVVLPFGTVNNELGIMNKLTELIQTEQIDRIVIGLPLGMDGGGNENTKRVQSFADALQTMAQVPVELYDERFSSQQADSMGGTASRDEKSAMVILESYLKSKK